MLKNETNLNKLHDHSAKSNVFNMSHTNVCQMRLFLAHSQSFQLYLMTYVERQKFYAEEGHVGYKQTASVCRIFDVIVLLHPPRSVIGSLSQGKICSMVSRLPFSAN